MAFKAGHAKAGGRQKGVANKSTQELEAICAKHNVNVFEAMVILAVKCEDEQKKFDRLKEIAQYLYSKRKQLEVETGEKGLVVRIEDYSTKE